MRHHDRLLLAVRLHERKLRAAVDVRHGGRPLRFGERLLQRPDVRHIEGSVRHGGLRHLQAVLGRAQLQGVRDVELQLLPDQRRDDLRRADRRDGRGGLVQRDDDVPLSGAVLWGYVHLLLGADLLGGYMHDADDVQERRAVVQQDE